MARDAGDRPGRKDIIVITGLKSADHDDRAGHDDHIGHRDHHGDHRHDRRPRPLQASEIRWDLDPAPWPSSAWLKVVIETLPTVKDSVAADVIEQLAHLVVDRDETAWVDTRSPLRSAETGPQSASRESPAETSSRRSTPTDPTTSPGTTARQLLREENKTEGQQQEQHQGQDKARQGQGQVDMRKTLRRWLTVKVLNAHGGAYTGTVKNVAEEQIRNPFTMKMVDRPVITFTDGYRIVPNDGMKEALIDAFGYESDNWRGRQITIRLQPGKVGMVKIVDIAPAFVSESTHEGDAGHEDLAWRDPEERESAIVSKTNVQWESH